MNAWIEVKLLTNTCFSSGIAGRAGDVDTDVEHDPETGLCRLRGRTLKGLLVEEIAIVLPALEPERAGSWHRAAGVLFGVPGAGHEHEASLRIGDGDLPLDLVAAVEAAKSAQRWSPLAVRDALTVIRRQTRIDRETGGPEAGSLRATRLLRAELCFLHPITFRRVPSASERAIVAAAVVSLRRVGLHRNRGWGRVALRILDEQQRDQTAEWLRPLAAEAPRRTEHDQPAPVSSAPPVEAARGSERARSRVVSYRLVLEAPLVLSTTGGDPNAVDTLRFVSGAAVLGAAARRFLANGGSADDDAFRSLFLSGETRWLHAYPEGHERRLVPAPLSMERPKGEQSPLHDRVVNSQPECQPASGWFVALAPDEGEGDGRIGHREAACSARVHHTRDRKAGRPTGEDLFAVVSIDVGERFVGHVLCEDGSVAAAVEGLLGQGPLQLGRSRTATYGGNARLELLASADGGAWCEVTALEEPDEDRLVCTLLSDYLGRDAHGQSSPRALASDLCRALGWPETVRPEHAFLGSRAASGYVSKWQMPRPRQTAVAAGSVLVFDGAPAPSAERVRDLLWRGLGERRAEGFGRVAVNWHGTKGTFRASEIERGSGPKPQTSAGPLSANLVLLRRNLVHDAVRAYLCRRGENDGQSVHPAPEPALVARLRSRIRTATKPEEVQGFLLDVEGKKAGRSLARARRGTEPLRDWIQRLVASEGDAPGWRSILDVDRATAPLGLDLGELPAEDLWPLLRVYLDALCEMLRRRAKEGKRAHQSGEAR
jgi:CRISPR-associated protein Csx10